MRFIRNKQLVAACIVTLIGILTCSAELHVYSHRHYGTDEKVNQLFTEKTGIEVKVVNADADQLIERLRSEGKSSPADVLITVDAGRIQRAATEGLLQPVTSETLLAKTPAELRSTEGLWYPFTLRMRGIVVSKEFVKDGEITTYEDLAKPKWRGRILARSSSSSYNQALLSSIVIALGEEKARDWAAGVVGNFARPPQGGDRDQIKAVAAGLADAAITNSYYLGLLLNSEDEADRKAGQAVKLFFPNQDGRGAHTNISAAGVVKTSDNVAEAIQYLEFLVSDEVQKLYATETYEHPISMDLSLSPQLKTWGPFKADKAALPKLGEAYPAAIRIFDQVGWK